MGLQLLARVLFHVGTFCLAFGLAALGALSITTPSSAALLYGLPIASQEYGFVCVAGLRDFGLAVAVLAIYAFEPRAMRAFVPALMLIPLGDAVLTISLGGTMIGALTHLAGTFAIGILTACAWLNPALNARPIEKQG
mmetsp:Transcript_16835/g.27925  ORF Transcript_16835/g.27925 Transcript_16835/m.27925 type:complete len:138 (-) Transcript_16835:257-670(-)